VEAPIGAAESAIAQVGGDSAGLPAPEWSSGLDSLLPVPKDLAPIVSPVFSAVDQVADQINSTVNVFLHRVGNWLAGLPHNNITTFLEGALLLVRRTLFNQDPDVTPVQEVTTSELIQGSLGGVDPDADPLSYAVVTGPELGEVVVDEYGDYVYTPGAGYAGSDSFTVRVATDRSGVNLLDLFGDGSTTVTVRVGDDAPTNPFEGEDRGPIDTTLYLADATATLVVDRQDGLGGSLDRIKASVTLEGVAADTDLSWMDAEGRADDDMKAGQILAEPGPASWWDEFAEAAELSGDGVRLGLDFTGEDGVQYTLILTQVVPDVNDAGQYVLSGVLADNPDEQPDIDVWDVVGPGYKVSYENFLATYVNYEVFLAPGLPEQVTLAVAGADLFIDTYSAVTFANQLVGADLGVSAQTLGIGTPEAAASGISQGSIAEPGVTAMIPYGDGNFVAGRADGSIKLRADGEWTLLKDDGWGSAVTKMMSYGDGIVVGLANGSIQQWTGSAWNELKCGGCGDSGFNSKVDAMLAYGDGFVVGLNNGSIQQWTGTEWRELHSWQTLSSESWPQFDDNSYNATFEIKNDTSVPILLTGMPTDGLPGDYTAPTQPIRKDTVLAPAGSLTLSIRNGSFGSYYNKTTWAFRSWSGDAQPNTGWDATVKSSGSANLFNSSSATCGGSCRVDGNTIYFTDGRPGTGPGQPYIQAMLPYRDGFVVGLYDGSVQQWNGSEWKELQEYNGWGSPVRSMLSYGDGFVLGLGNGSVQKYTGSGWQELQPPALSVNGQGWGSPAQSLLAYRDGFVVGLGNGSVQQYTGSGWQQLQPQGWGSGVKAMLPFGDGFVVGLDNSSVQRYTGSSWEELQGTGWASSVTAMVPRSDFQFVDGDGETITRQRFTVGLENGSIQQWVGTNWQELNPFKVDILDSDTLKQAVEYAFNGGDDAVAADGAPIFSKKEFLPSCGGPRSCDGSFYPFNLKSDEPYQLASKTFDIGANGQKLELSYDVKHVVYGYAYVPAGVWGKLNLNNYSGGFLLGLPTGPSVKLDVGTLDEPYSSGDIELFSKEFYKPTPYGIFSLNADVQARLDVALKMPDDFDKDALRAHAYFVPGLLVTYNTDAFDGLQFGYDWYLDTDFKDFEQIRGVSIVPSLTPTVTGTYGLFTPETTPIIGKKTIASVNLGYTNPVKLTLDLEKGQDPSLTFNSSGTLTYGAGILQVLTDSLSFNDELEIYNYTSDNLWPWPSGGGSGRANADLLL